MSALQHGLHRRFRQLWAAMALPPTLLHELTHAVASAPWASRVGIEIDRSGRAMARIRWMDSAGAVAKAFTGLAPALSGLMAAVVAVFLWVESGGEIPESAAKLAKLSILTTWWVIYSTPSGGDLSMVVSDSNE